MLMCPDHSHNRRKNGPDTGKKKEDRQNFGRWHPWPGTDPGSAGVAISVSEHFKEVATEQARIAEQQAKAQEKARAQAQIEAQARAEAQAKSSGSEKKHNKQN
ncbi:MAG: hypothetical protein LRY39_00955 [Alphaproteobacteria bacterium]|nr:hypothetical protein [Alphaproteobacteria bacterium]